MDERSLLTVEVEASDNAGLVAAFLTGFGFGAEIEAAKSSASNAVMIVKVQTFPRPIRRWLACECRLLERPPFEVFFVPTTHDTSLMTLLA